MNLFCLGGLITGRGCMGVLLYRLQAKKELNIGRILYKSLSQSIRETVITPPHSARYGAEIRRRQYEIYCFIVSFISFHRPIYIISSPRNIGFQCPKPSIWGKKTCFCSLKRVLLTHKPLICKELP